MARLAVGGAAAAGAVLLFAGTASAHVTVQPQGDAAKGGSAVVDFKVPNERDHATTTKLEVNFPTDHPLASVMPEPVPGWKIDVTTSKLAKPLEVHGSQVTEAVSKVTWTAQSGAGIPVGEFQQFPVSLSTLPTDTDQLSFKALQTYSNKEVVRWIETQQPGAPEPEDPAPVLKLTAAAADGSAPGSGGGPGASATAATAKSGGTETASSASSNSSNGTDDVARVLGIVGIVIGAAGVAYGLLVGRRRSA
ncbi:DUF1775 domain-containing protein [Streptomyces sp. DW26H14]|uniref:DUF1775 domain-containing protein n=1 Tax=Streptomyces sp. DW26H14 TaxID=3435395 RepID=UPI00403D8243